MWIDRSEESANVRCAVRDVTTIRGVEQKCSFYIFTNSVVIY